MTIACLRRNASCRQAALATARWGWRKIFFVLKFKFSPSVNGSYIFVIPAKAGIHILFFCIVPCFHRDSVWIPVCTGMTGWGRRKSL
ncbi:MAG: hypothetical protein A2169_10020 [Deltaproteobacteria bacterium RBG_13_47_9]|nr:MAG: hypothetical protein A2169_10020 [Deltaproteobacteria bacterium RBG_13_47_9]